jgi:hypothetical protein
MRGVNQLASVLVGFHECDGNEFSTSVGGDSTEGMPARRCNLLMPSQRIVRFAPGRIFHAAAAATEGCLVLLLVIVLVIGPVDHE